MFPLPGVGVSGRREQLMALIEPAVVALGYELADVELNLGRGRGLLRLFIDAEAGITLDDCERVSRQISGLLDVEDPIPGDYNLEVSSPGLDRKLVKPAHFDRFAGELVNVRLLRMLDGQRRLRGRLLRREGESIVIEIDAGSVTVPIADIEVARLVPEVATGSKRGSARAG